MKKKPDPWRTNRREYATGNPSVRRTVRQLRKDLLTIFRVEKARHWKMRGTHRLGVHFEHGFFRGINHAYDLTDQLTLIILGKGGAS